MARAGTQRGWRDRARLTALLAGLAAREGAARALDPLRPRRRRIAARRARRARAARRVAGALGALGGPYAKLGQLAALRVDALDPEVRAALSGIFDGAPALPFPVIRARVEAELGAPLARHFARFEPTPLGTASVAQVHGAILHDGTPVAVKVVRPDVEGRLESDLRLLRRVWRRLARRRGAAAAAADALFDELAARLRGELDLAREAASAREIAALLADDPEVVVPGLHPGLSTARVFVMDHAPGVRVDDRAGLARLGAAPAEVARRLLRAYARQVLEHGVFHADPHPGNVFVMDEPDAARRPRLLLLDFGLCERLDPGLRTALRRLGHGLLARDAAATTDAMEALGALAPGARGAVERTLAEELSRTPAAPGALLSLGTPDALALARRARDRLGETEGLVLPAPLLLTARTLVFAVRLAHELDPSLDAARELAPWVVRFLAGPAMAEARPAPARTAGPPGAGPGGGG